MSLKEIEKAVKADPENQELRLELAGALESAGKDRRAVAEYLTVAQAFRTQSRFAAAARLCRTILRIDPEHEETKALLQLLDELDKNAPAEPAWEEPSVPPELVPYTRSSRLLDVPPPPETLEEGDGEDELEVTDPHHKRPAAESTRVLGQPRLSQQITAVHKAVPPESVPETAPAEPAETPDDGGLELAQAFDRPFAAAVDALAPDGTTIEEPLAVFKELPAEALRELQRRISIRRCPNGTIIVREGDPGDAAFVVQSGSVRILKRDPVAVGAGHIEVVRLGPGSMFGEFALLADRRRHATVQAAEATELYEIPRRVLKDLASQYPEVGPALERLYRERLVSTLISTAPFFRPLPEEDRGPLMNRFRPVKFDDGATIIREGEAGGGLYLVVLGTVEISKDVEGAHPVLLASLGEGSYFGEMSLLKKGGIASATVTAAGPVECAQLPPKDFYATVSAYPILWEELRKEAQRRELANQFILAGDADLV